MSHLPPLKFLNQSDSKYEIKSQIHKENEFINKNHQQTKYFKN